MSGRTKLSRKLTALLNELFPARKVKLIFQEYHAEHFGNEIVEYEFEDFRLFFVKDRSQLFVDLEPKTAPGRRVALPALLERIGAGKISDFTEYNFQTVKRQLELLGRNEDRMIAAARRI